MTADVSVRSRAHRTLNKLSNFVNDPTLVGETLDRLGMEPGEELIGVYSNPSASERVVVTSSGLYVVGSNTIMSVAFAAIVRIEGPSTTSDESDLAVYTSVGEKIVVPIRGQHGQFRDVFEFQRFLARVLEDKRR
jgi:hypothetical protein